MNPPLKMIARMPMWAWWYWWLYSCELHPLI
jgi:hypothetical protein